MRVVFVIPSLCQGGAERVASVLSDEWSREHEVTFVVFDGRDPSFRQGGRFVDLGLPAVAHLPGKARNGLLRVVGLAKLLREVSPDRIISFIESANFPTILASLLTGNLRRTVVSVRNNPVAHGRLTRALVKLLYPLAHGIVTNTDGAARVLRNLAPRARDRVTVIRNPVDIPGVQLLAAAEPSCPVPPGFLLAVGRLARVKRFDLLLTAYSQLAPRHPEPLVILGSGPELPRLQVLAERLGVAERVHFLGPVANPYAYMRRASCLALTSETEGWPNVIVEGMVVGCPVVSFDCPFGPSELIESGENGTLVPNGDVGALASELERILTNAPLRRRMADAAFASISGFHVSQVAREWLIKR